jgi:hypothetical protein
VSGLSGGGAHDSTPHDSTQVRAIHLTGQVGLAANQPYGSGTLQTLLLA